MPKIVRRYTEIDVAGILKRSEGHGATNGRGQGHSESLHELVSVGRGRKHTSEQGLEQRILDERKARVGSFDNCQVKAITP